MQTYAEICSLGAFMCEVLEGYFDSGQPDFKVSQVSANGAQPFQVFFQVELTGTKALLFATEVEKVPLLNYDRKVFNDNRMLPT